MRSRSSAQPQAPSLNHGNLHPMPLPSRTLTVSIDRPADIVYDFARNPENLPRWSFIESVSKEGDAWIAHTPDGPVTIRFADPNPFGILDHVVTVSPGVDVYVPMRVIANGEGSEVLFTLFRLPGVTDEQFERDAQTVGEDLRRLKAVVEGASHTDCR